MRTCDIIIPIYNAYEYTEKCIESVIKNTKFSQNKLILIDDKSPDERVWPLLKKYKAKYSFVDIYQNEENKGFVGTINIGMQISTNDVLLLNSDTEVTSRWLEKIATCAYSKKNVATVTPLSNNATLASVPKAFFPNDIPKGYTLEEMADLVEKCSKKEYPEIPTGHGFCLYIKREILEEIGFFDEKTYGKGYGEENDFCFRCLDHGYCHLMCDNTYIFHKESQSFSEEKTKLQEIATQKLNERYPKYFSELNLWCQMKPLKYIADNIALKLEEKKKHKNILYIIHDWDLKNLGGTTMHALDLIKYLRKEFNIHVLTIAEENYKLYSYWQENETIITYPKLSEFHALNFYNEKWKKIVEEIIENFDIHFVHIQHLRFNYFDIVDIIKKYKLKTLLSIHDYYCVCPLITKMYQNDHYCGKYDLKQCNSCLKAVYHFDYNSIINWQNNWQELFSVCNKIICPSVNCKNEIMKTYPKLELKVIEHGTELHHEKSNLTIENDKVLNIAFVGAIGLHKGGKIFNDLIYKHKNKKIKIHLFGISDRDLPKNSKYFQNHGKYNRQELSKLFKENDIKLACLLSICPETFSYTLSECIACGVPVLGFNIGAINDRIQKYNLGWIIDKESNADEILQVILKIKNNPNEYKQKINSLNNYKLKSTNEMCNEYKKIYDSLLEEVKEVDININSIFEKIKNSNDYDKMQINYVNYAWILNTLKWKIISKVKIPKFIKRLYQKVKKNEKNS